MTKIFMFVLKFCLGLLPSILLIAWLLRQFPHTGLGRIIGVPMAVLVNVVIVIAGIMLSARIDGKAYQYLLWTVVVLLTLAVTLFFYPQDYGPPITVKIWQYFFGQ
ncbi:hypothetical protein DNH61_02755 [Paenibacillus sambharensis]|uniref:Uncharacterized protein n=1 Tax=Paenibacillus sambharensis TaxID=1803190 RepID=A0A2W1LQR1_9BACL|nr:hypothetical protein [Paenibacillus sambharensis]PZD97292.1 hypothetical protein DNH61_02755 [Paenibacillus sambharensis]